MPSSQGGVSFRRLSNLVFAESAQQCLMSELVSATSRSSTMQTVGGALRIYMDMPIRSRDYLIELAEKCRA